MTRRGVEAVVVHSDPDLLIAATAIGQDLTLVTCNVRHFEPTGVRLLNPYRSS